MCLAVQEAYLQKWWHLAARMVPVYGEHWDIEHMGHLSTAIDGDYLPSIDDNIHYLYKLVTCESPPDVTNDTTILDGTLKDVHQLHEVIQYACINQGFQMKGNSSISCLYNG